MKPEIPQRASLVLHPRASSARARARLRGCALASALSFVGALAGCNRNATPSVSSSGTPTAAPAPGDAAARATPGGGPAVEEIAGTRELWTRAEGMDPDDLARLANREGVAGLLAKGREGQARAVALRALGYTEGDLALPTLARAASSGTDVEAQLALESAADLAARPRRAVDIEDGDAFREGADLLLGLAKDTSKPRARRVGAVRALRMTLDRGSAKPEDIPTDVDAR